MDDIVGSQSNLLSSIEILEGLIVEAGIVNSAPLSSFDLMVV
jgi:hypothetical protein